MLERYNPIDDMPDYAEWAHTAKGVFNFADYLHAQVLQGRITADVLGAIMGWLWPSFVEVDGLVILASSMAKLVERKAEGITADNLEYWCNFTNVDGILPGMPVSFSGDVASIIRDMWSAKLQTEFSTRKFVVKIVELREFNEFSVTFHQD